MSESGGVHGQDCSTVHSDAGLTPAKAPQSQRNPGRLLALQVFGRFLIKRPDHLVLTFIPLPRAANAVSGPVSCSKAVVELEAEY